jgi:hypothetical protein
MKTIKVKTQKTVIEFVQKHLFVTKTIQNYKRVSYDARKNLEGREKALKDILQFLEKS